MAKKDKKKRAAVPKSERKRYMVPYRFIRFMVKFFYPKITLSGLENLPDEPAIYVGNHTQMNGPIIGELYFPVERDTWCISEMMHLTQVPAYAYKDFWSEKPKYIRWFYKILSYIIAPIAHVVFNSANTIEVHTNLHIIQTFKDTSEDLSQGRSIVIFPECRKPFNNIVYEFQPGFVDAARYHYKKTGKDVLFVPIYNAPALKKLCIGKPVRFNHENDKEIEKERLCTYLKEEITRVATELPRHRVVPYPNMSKKDYPYSRQE